jgi:soluble lytic murein transglycosylase-like protein
LFVGAFLVTGAVQAVTGFSSALPSAATVPQESSAETSEKDFKFTGSAEPIKPGSVPKKRWEELINQWGNKCEALTPALLAAQLHQESAGFDPDVIAGRRHSPAGAKGIAQFMDTTWKAHAIDANKDGKRNKFDVEDAIPSAAVYDCEVAKYVRKVPGNKSDNMLAAYNAGSYAVKKYGGVPNYRETRNYVRIIKQRAGRYER